MAIHHEVHPEHVDGCFKCHLLSVSLQTGPTTPTLTERRWEKDMPAYKRLRNNGLQPRSIDGAAEIEARASSQFEVTSGHLFPTKELQAKMREGIARAQELTA